MISGEDLIEMPTTIMECTNIVSPPTSRTDPSASPASSSNMINLTMRLKADQAFYTDKDADAIVDRVHVMLMQESTTYKVGGIGDDTSNLRRPIMVDWNFHVVDHYGLDREIVEVAFSYLDRFVERCSTDDAAFKLASMTCLYIASKNIGPKYISLKSLSELSEGEFDIHHFVDMELIILKALDWRVQPPTTKTFIELFLAFLPSNKIAMKQAVRRRALFYSELSLFEYNCALERKSLLTLSSILNAIQDIYPKNLSETITRKFVGELMFALKLHHEETEINETQRSLSELYKGSEQYRLYEANKLCLLGTAAEKKFVGTRGRTFSKDSVSSEANGSPVCVWTEMETR
mmetsp:Transcript_5375/g.9130  ORF Transcript_5375/g.9130 Transcript_5375/m.9130 type:complete len:348 (-) Transcript_5375:136-1179(-)